MSRLNHLRRVSPVAARGAIASHRPLTSVPNPALEKNAACEALVRGEQLAAQALCAPERLAPFSPAVLTGADGNLCAETAAWAVMGALERGNTAVARATLEALFIHQQADGRLPVRLVRRKSLLARLMSCLRSQAPMQPPAFQANFAADATATARASMLLAWSGAEYALHAGDAAFADRHAVSLEAAVDWVDGHLAPTPVTNAQNVGMAAAYHQAQMALGHLAIARGDAVSGARRWAAAAAAKGRIQDAERSESVTSADVLLAVLIGACDADTTSDALMRVSSSVRAGLVALAAIRAGELEAGEAALVAAAKRAIAANGFACAGDAGAFIKALNELRRAQEVATREARLSAPVSRRQLELSEDEARILSAC